MNRSASIEDLEKDAAEEVSREFRVRLSTFQSITRERKQSLLQETTIMHPVLEQNANYCKSTLTEKNSNENDDIAPNDEKLTRSSTTETVDEATQYKIPRLAPLHVTCAKGTGDGSGALVVQFWQNLPQVKESGILKKLDAEQIAMNEAMFEIIKASKSYYKSLCIITDHFKKKIEEKFGNRFKYICQQLFLNIPTLANVTDRLINRLEEVQADNIEIQHDCIAVVRFFAENLFEEPYVKYCSRKDQQNIALREIEKNKEMSTYVAMLEKDPICQMLPLSAFLLLPMQMLTRWPILLLAVQKHGERSPRLHMWVKNTIKQVEKLALTCNSYRDRLAHEQRLIQIEKNIDFPKSFRFPLTAMKSKSKIFHEETFQVILPDEQGVYNSKSLAAYLRNRSNRNDFRLITFDDGSVLILLQKDHKECYKFVNYSPVWSVLTDQGEIAGNVRDNFKSYMRLSKEYDCAVVTLTNGFLHQPNKLLFLFKKTDSDSHTRLLECAEKSPPVPRIDSLNVLNLNGNGPNTNKEDIFEDESPSSRFKKNLKLAKSAENLNCRPATSSISYMQSTRKMRLRKLFESLDRLDANSDEDENVDLSSDEDSKNQRSSTLDEVLTNVSLASKRRRSVPSRMAMKVSSPFVQNNILHISNFKFPECEETNKEAQDETNEGAVVREMAMLTRNSHGSMFSVIVIKAYRPERSDELDVDEGDVVNIEKGPIQGWVFGRKRGDDSLCGWFPFNHTRPVKAFRVETRPV